MPAAISNLVLYKTFTCKKSYASFMRFLGYQCKVLCEPCVDMFSLEILLYKTQNKYYSYI